MGIFGWDYPPGCSSVPGDEPDEPADLTYRLPALRAEASRRGYQLEGITHAWWHLTEDTLEVWYGPGTPDGECQYADSLSVFLDPTVELDGDQLAPEDMKRADRAILAAAAELWRRNYTPRSILDLKART